MSDSQADRSILYVQRGDVWVPAIQWRVVLLRLVKRWAGVALACGLLLMLGAVAGLYAAHKTLDRQSAAFAETTAKGLLPTLAHAAPSDGVHQPPAQLDYCYGRASIGLVTAPLGVTASYTCALTSAGVTRIALISVRKELNAWKTTAVYIDPPLAAPAPVPSK